MRDGSFPVVCFNDDDSDDDDDDDDDDNDAD